MQFLIFFAIIALVLGGGHAFIAWRITAGMDADHKRRVRIVIALLPIVTIAAFALRVGGVESAPCGRVGVDGLVQPGLFVALVHPRRRARRPVAGGAHRLPDRHRRRAARSRAAQSDAQLPRIRQVGRVGGALGLRGFRRCGWPAGSDHRHPNRESSRGPRRLSHRAADRYPRRSDHQGELCPSGRRRRLRTRCGCGRHHRRRGRRVGAFPPRGRGTPGQDQEQARHLRLHRQPRILRRRSRVGSLTSTRLA